MSEPDSAELRDERTADAFGRPGDFLYAVIGGLLVMVAVAAAGHPSHALGQPRAIHLPHPRACGSARTAPACTVSAPMIDQTALPTYSVDGAPSLS